MALSVGDGALIGERIVAVVGAAPGVREASRPRLFRGPHGRASWSVCALVSLFAFEEMGVAAALPNAVADVGGLNHFGWAFTSFLALSVVGMASSAYLCDRHGPRTPIIAFVVVFASGLVVAGTATTMVALVLRASDPRHLGWRHDDGGVRRRRDVHPGDDATEALRGDRVVLGHTGHHRPHRIGRHRRAPELALDLPRRRSPHPRGRRRARAGALRPGARPWKLWSVGRAGLEERGGCLSNLVRAARRARDHRRAGRGGGPGLDVAARDRRRRLLVLAIAMRRLLPAGTARLESAVGVPVALRGIMAGALFGVEAVIPLMMTTQHGLGALRAAIPLACAGLPCAIAVWWMGRTGNDSIGRRVTMARTGFVLLSVATASFIWLSRPSSPSWPMGPFWAIAGLGLGLVLPSMNVLALERTTDARERSSHASSPSDRRYDDGVPHHRLRRGAGRLRQPWIESPST